MTYRWVTTGELTDELESYSQRIAILASQMEKIDKLRSKGKISDPIYAEFNQGIYRDIESVLTEGQDLIEVANARVKEIGNEVNELKYRLERLELRNMLGFISEEMYAVARDGLVSKIAEYDETMTVFGKMISIIDEASNKIECHKSTEELNFEGTYNESQLNEDKVVKSLKNSTHEPQIEAIAAPLNGGAFCPVCHIITRKDANFCDTCGTKLGDKLGEKPLIKMEQTVAAVEEVSTQAIEEERNKATTILLIRAKPKPKRGDKAGSENLKVKICKKCGMENLSIAAYCYLCNTSFSDILNDSVQKPWGRP